MIEDAGGDELMVDEHGEVAVIDVDAQNSSGASPLHLDRIKSAVAAHIQH